MTKIKFGTDGWRAIIAKDFTVDNVARVSIATAQWLNVNFDEPSVVIGYDCRFGGKLFAETTAKVLLQAGVKVYLDKNFVSTPMVSLGAVRLKSSLGVVITASHNPASYNGYKLKGSFGGPLFPKNIQEIEDVIPNENKLDLENIKLHDFEKKGQLEYVDLEEIYVEHVEQTFDLDLIRNCGLNFAYDAMYGAGQNVMKRLFPEMTFLHCDYNPSFMGQAPEPIHKNLIEFSELIKEKGNIASGLATDGDADRIGLYNSKGEFIDSHHIILLLMHYLVEHKKLTGKVVDTFSCSQRIKKMVQHHKLDVETVKIGFKYICEIMVNEDVLIGGEESGGIAIKTHVPERDGIWMGLTVWEFMAKSGKSLEQLIDEVYAIVGSFAFERNDLHIEESQKVSIIENCKAGNYDSFGDYKVQRVETLDGFKFFFSENEWLMIRPSGTEPVLRTYAEADTSSDAFKILKACEETILN